MTRGCGNDPRHAITGLDAEAVAEFRAYLLARKTVAEYEAAPRTAPAACADRMTPAQLALLTAVAHGVTQQQLTRRFGVSHPAVSKQLRAARRWLGAETVAHAVFLATRAGLIPDAATEAAVRPVAAPDAPEPRRDAAGRSGGDGTGFNGDGRASSAGVEATGRPVRPAQTPGAPDPHRDTQKPPRSRTAPQETPPCPN